MKKETIWVQDGSIYEKVWGFKFIQAILTRCGTIDDGQCGKYKKRHNW